jgi:hypothetical protein
VHCGALLRMGVEYGQKKEEASNMRASEHQHQAQG